MPREAGEAATVLSGGLLIDGSGAPAVEDGVVVMQGGRIVAAGAVEVPADATMINVTGKTIMPGMIEGNSHIIFDGQSNHPAYFAGRYRDYYEIGARNLYASLMQGITTSRDTMDPLEEMIRLREDVESGVIAGSRLFTSGTILNYPGVYRMFDDPTDSVVEGISRGVEYAKAANGAAGARRAQPRDRRRTTPSAAPTSSRSEHTAGRTTAAGTLHRGPHEIVDEAHAARTAGHDPHVAIESIVAVLDAGVDAMEHPTLVGREEVGPQGEFSDELVQRFVDQNVYSVSLMVVREVYVTYMEDPSRLEDPWYIRHAPADMVQEAREWVARDLAREPEALEEHRAGYELGRLNLAKLIAAGAPIAMGTDRKPASPSTRAGTTCENSRSSRVGDDARWRRSSRPRARGASCRDGGPFGTLEAGIGRRDVWTATAGDIGRCGGRLGSRRGRYRSDRPFTNRPRPEAT